MVRGFHVPLECSFDHLLAMERRVEELVVYCRVDSLAWACRDSFDFHVAAVRLWWPRRQDYQLIYTERRGPTNDSWGSCYLDTITDIKVVLSR